MRTATFTSLVAIAACGNVDSPHPDARSIDAAPTADAPATDAPTSCDPTAPFGAPVAVGGLATSGTERTAQFLPDELTVVFSGVVGTDTTYTIYQASRATADGSFGTPVALDVSSTTAADFAPTVSADGLMLVFTSDRVANEGNHLYVATRASTAAAFSAPALLGGVASPTATDSDSTPFITADGEELWFGSGRTPNPGVYRATKSGTGYANPVAVPELNPAPFEVLSADRLTVYFARQGAGTGFDIWVAHRSTTNDGFGPATLVSEASTSGNDEPTWISPDNCRLYLESDIAGTMDIYVATRSQ